MLFPALRFKNESLGRDFCFCRVVDEFVAAWGSVMAFRVKNYEILGVFI